MFHNRNLRRFSRTREHRRAMLRNLATSLLDHERIKTTVHKAKDLRRVVEGLIAMAGKDNLHNRRQALSYLKSKDVVKKLFVEIGPRFKARPGGYTRVVRTWHRPGDNAEMAMIELVERSEKKAQPEPADKTATEKKSKKAAAPKEKAEGKKEAAPKAAKKTAKKAEK